MDDYRLDRIEPLVEHGGRVSWSPHGEWIVRVELDELRGEANVEE